MTAAGTHVVVGTGPAGDSYVPDVGHNLVLLGTRDDGYGQVWHLPNPETRTTRHAA